MSENVNKKVRTCSIEGCCWKHKAKGLCKKHYHQLKRGTLENPRYKVSRPPVGMPRAWSEKDWPIDMKKIDGVWHRRLTGTDNKWQPVVWR